MLLFINVFNILNNMQSIILKILLKIYFSHKIIDNSYPSYVFFG